MLDINFIKENLELCKKAAIHKNRTVDWDTLLQLDEKRRFLILKKEELRQKRNSVGKLDKEEERKKGRELKDALKEIEDEFRKTEEAYTNVMLTVPNIPDEQVPIGKDSSENVTVRTWGEIPKFDFPVKDHIEIAKRLDLIDFERGVKVGGSRAYFLKNDAVLLELGILMYSLKKLIEKGYTPLVSPSLVRAFTFVGNGQFPWGKEEVYELPKDELFLAGTAEVPVTSYYADEILREEDLPKKFVAFSPCYRREAGSYGKDTKGVYRVHQFNKVEQLIVSTNDTSTSLTLLDDLLANSESILQDLGLPYRVLLMCTGDMGEPQVKKYDIETWMPGRTSAGSGQGSSKDKELGEYGETMSDSFMGDFQARRLKIRYKTKEGKIVYCHTLNNTAIASPRILIPILENYQQKDGSVRVPDVLIPYVGKEYIKSK